ncbi:TetR/AcrR family transcriptional regulator [Natronomonas sp. EA1]|uniref:TetR/AcrR family transcriptional regulator n=1 Tax=Natronomonas sp. EA1 TaxID=3421655 RepID=UPI003EBAAE22
MSNARSETQVAIMEATYEALAEHGYADLTIQAIADAFPKSKSLLYYHYETKDAILTDFLSYLLDLFFEEVTLDDEAPPVEAIQSFIEQLLAPELTEEERSLWVALIELRTRAAHNDAYRERFDALDAGVIDALAAIIERGIESGEFRDVDAHREAEFLIDTINGAVIRRVTTDDTVAATAREALDDYIDRVLVA